MIDQFTKEQFENTLFTIHPGYEPLGLMDGEEVYTVPVNENTRLKIRSSVDRSGYAADTGQDSIRLWLEVWQPNGTGYTWEATGKKIDAYTTRVSGWEKRLRGKVEKLWKKAVTVRQPVEQCETCNGKRVYFVSKDTPNKGRPFASCRCENGFEWLDSPEIGGTIVFDDTEPGQEEVAYNEGSDIVREEDTGTDNALLDSDAEQSESESLPEVLEKIPGYEGLNDAQYQAATAPLDVNIRLLAPPGSGKTHTVKHRYQYLTENGVNPDNILVVTFSKAMADEMGHKIAELVPFANTDQISTIHAFCYRLLRNWYDTPYSGYNFPKQGWKVKSILDDLIAVTWGDNEKPNYSEVLNYIDAAKYHNQFNQQWFIDALGYRFGGWLWEIAEQFQRTMQSSREMMFGDMLLYTEQLLDSDADFRAWCHNRFEHIIVDEAQDTNWQAMRILLAISENVKPCSFAKDKP